VSGVGANTLLSGAMADLLVRVAGTVLVLFSAFCFGAGVWRELRAADTLPKSHVMPIARAILRIVNGALVLVSLAALVGIWLRR
jgi:putative membrane protein